MSRSALHRVAVSVAEQGDQYDDGKGNAKKQKYNRTHLKLLNQSENTTEIIDECPQTLGLAPPPLDNYYMISLSSSDCRGEACAERPK